MKDNAVDTTPEWSDLMKRVRQHGTVGGNELARPEVPEAPQRVQVDRHVPVRVGVDQDRPLPRHHVSRVSDARAQLVEHQMPGRMPGREHGPQPDALAAAQGDPND